VLLLILGFVICPAKDFYIREGNLDYYYCSFKLESTDKPKEENKFTCNSITHKTIIKIWVLIFPDLCA
jgi:hypothetical protein